MLVQEPRTIRFRSTAPRNISNLIWTRISAFNPMRASTQLPPVRNPRLLSGAFLGLAVIAVLVFLPVLSSLADGVVANCTEAALREALAGGGAVTFACDGTIVLSSTLSNSLDTVLDGANHQVTISGGTRVRVFYVGTNVHVSLLNLTVADGFARNGAGIFNDGGSTVLSNVIVRNNTALYEAGSQSSGLAEGGGVFNKGGSINATNCTFSRNVAWQTNDVYIELAQARGAAICNATGEVMLKDCRFDSNEATGPPQRYCPRDGCGGAIYNAGTLIALECEFLANSATGGLGAGSGNGGAICNLGQLLVTGGVFHGNAATGTEGSAGLTGFPMDVYHGGPGGSGGKGGNANGGALFNAGVARVADARFTANRGVGGPGGSGGDGGTVFFPPHPGDKTWGGPGGSGGTGGAAYGAICDITAQCVLSNCVLQSNVGIRGDGGAGGSGGSGNYPGPAGARGADGNAAGGIYSIGALLFDCSLIDNVPGGDCFGTFTDAGGNRCSDGSCGFTPFGTVPPSVNPTYCVLYNFGEEATMYHTGPSGPLVLAPDGMLYGCAEGSSKYPSNPAVFSLRQDGTGSSFGLLRYFPGAVGGLQLSGSNLFGISRLAGNNQGSCFRLRTDGTDYTDLVNFQGSLATNPSTDLVLSGAALYGTSYGWGYLDCGEIYSLQTDGSGFKILKQFSGGSDGCSPGAGLSLSGTTLYGATQGAGTTGDQTLFKINTDGSGYTVLQRFNGGSEGFYPVMSVLSDSTLYGTTSWGVLGGDYFATIFRMSTDGTGFTTLKTFSGPPNGGVRVPGLVVMGNTLFGVMSGGGTWNLGTIFKIGTDGNGYAVLKEFNGRDGANPSSQLVLADNSLFGTTPSGGFYGEGVVFQFKLSAPMLALNPASQTTEVGSSVEVVATVSGCPAPVCQWYRNGTNSIPGAKQPVLQLSNIQLRDAGVYSLIAVNELGKCTNSVVISVIPAVERTSVLGIHVTGQPGKSMQIEFADALVSVPLWESLADWTMTNTTEFCFDSSPSSQRYYRAGQPAPAAEPGINLETVPAIKLSGPIGSTLRVDWINPVGPTNAWSTLATITLATNPQLYLDTSASGGPRRLYRIVPAP